MGKYAKRLELRLTGRPVPTHLKGSANNKQRNWGREILVSPREQAADLEKCVKVSAGSADEVVRIYRMEKPIWDGRETSGPWHIGIHEPELENLSWRYKRELRHIPEPEQEGLPMHSGMLCGMLLNRRHIRTWVPYADTWDALYEQGFRLNIYEVPGNHVYSGTTQVTYYPSKAKLVGEADMEWFRRWRNNCLKSETEDGLSA